MLTQCEETVSLKVEEIEQLKWQLEAAQQELLLFKDQVCFSIEFVNYHKHLYGQYYGYQPYGSPRIIRV